MIAWLIESVAGRFLTTFLISMVPVIELRGGLPYGITLGLPYPLALTAAVLGNMLPVPFIIVYIQRIFAWLRRIWAKFDGMVSSRERRADRKGDKVRRYGLLGLVILVAIPLPGTGAWTGALVAALLKMKLKDAVPAIFLGVLIAAAIMTAITFGVIHLT
jgi:uncharacterized membrane protein